MSVCEFGVHGADHDPHSGCIAVVGRCFVGPIELGTIFTDLRHGEDREATAIALTVTSIEAYGRRFGRLDEGMTAKLLLRGAAASVQDGTVLRAEV